MPLAELPEDVLTIIFSLLAATDFLAICSTCRTLFQFQQDPAYWRNITSRSFRLPISPLLKAEGLRWFHLYRRLKTQTHIYTWGQGVRGNLGLGISPRRLGPRIIARRGPPRPTGAFQRVSSTWPTNTAVPEEIKVIADLQCGGWSTSVLSSEGKIYTVGIIDSQDGAYIGPSVENFTQLHYLTESTSAIRQFSSGRRHILGLTDDGEIISWDRTGKNGLKIFSKTGRDFGGGATKVVAGWGESSAYVPETGIVFWTPVKNDQQDDMLDGWHVSGRIVPGSARTSVAEQSIEVLAHVVLEGMIVWISSDSKLFACDLQVSTADQDRPDFEPFEVPGFTASDRRLLDIQGQFNKFVVITDKDEVLAGDTNYLKRCAARAQAQFHPGEEKPEVIPATWNGVDQVVTTRPQDVPALQHSHVIQLAFGDHHYQALHADGKVTTYGTDSLSCGALGIGDAHTGARFRGLRPLRHWGQDMRFVPGAETKGRHVWYEPEKREWLSFLEDSLSKTQTLGPNAEAEWAGESPEQQLLFSQWVEQEGEHWNDGPADSSHTTTLPINTKSSMQDDFHLDPYFTISIAASGWHSGALVLVDEAKAHEVREKWLVREAAPASHTEAEQNLNPSIPGAFVDDPPKAPEETFIWRTQGFPKVRLPNAHVMPGTGEIREWRGGEPTDMLTS